MISPDVGVEPPVSAPPDSSTVHPTPDSIAERKVERAIVKELVIEALGHAELPENPPEPLALTDSGPSDLVVDEDLLDEESESLSEVLSLDVSDDTPLPDVDEGDTIENLDIHLASLAPSTKKLMDELFRAHYIRYIPPK